MRKSARDKAALTLGELYRRMSSDFRAVRPEGHSGCVMPMVVASRKEGESNWAVEPLTSHCPFCRTLTQMIASEYASRFEVRYFPEESPPQMPFIAEWCCGAD